jgi:UDP-N-acetyl-D-mannosaminuronate dehydrogenase
MTYTLIYILIYLQLRAMAHDPERAEVGQQIAQMLNSHSEVIGTVQAAARTFGRLFYIYILIYW